MGAPVPTPSSFREFDPAALSQIERYKLLVGGVVPRPIAWVSTRSIDGADNLAPFSFFCGVGSDPMTMLFCPANNPDGSEKDSLRNAKSISEGGTGEFVVNVVPHRLAQAMNQTSANLPIGTSEFEACGVASAPCRVVSARRVLESPVAYECATIQVIRTNPGVSNGGNIVLGRVVHVWVADGVANERLQLDPGAIDAVGRMGGFGYSTTRDRFEIARPD